MNAWAPKSRRIASSRDTLHELLAHLEDAFLLIAHSRLPKPSVSAGIEVLTTWQWMMSLH